MGLDLGVGFDYWESKYQNVSYALSNITNILMACPHNTMLAMLAQGFLKKQAENEVRTLFPRVTLLFIRSEGL